MSPRCHAFTLVELLVVVTLIAGLTAVAAPSIVAQVRAAQVLSGARQVVALAALARHEAARSGRDLTLVAEAGRLTVLRGTTVVVRRDLPEGASVAVDAATGAAANAPLTIFRGDGTARPARLAVLGADGRRVLVLIDGPTGLARVEG